MLPIVYQVLFLDTDCRGEDEFTGWDCTKLNNTELAFLVDVARS